MSSISFVDHLVEVHRYHLEPARDGAITVHLRGDLDDRQIIRTALELLRLAATGAHLTIDFDDAATDVALEGPVAGPAAPRRRLAGRSEPSPSSG